MLARAGALSRQVSVPTFQEVIGPFEMVGTWRFVMSYPGDANNFPAASACGAYRLEVTKASAFLTPLVSPLSVEVGKPAQVGANLYGYRPSGSLTVRVFAPGDISCSSAVQSRVFTVSGAGPYALSFTPTTVGTWQVTASYEGDDANTAAALSCGVASGRGREGPADACARGDARDGEAELHTRRTPDARRRLQPDRQRRVSAVRSAGHGVHDSDACRDRRTELRRRAHHDRLPALERKRRNLELDGLVLGRPQQCSELDGLRIRARRRDRPGTDPARATYRFASGTTWTVYSDYPGEGQASTELGTAQLVCLSAAGCPAGATDYGSPFGGAWTSNLSSIPGAGWIWRPGVTGATPNADFDEAVFATTFVLAGRPASGWIDIAVDDSAEIRVNGEVVGSIGRGAYGSLTRFDLSAFLRPGHNTLAIKATNGPWCGTCPFSQDPAGVVFGGTIAVG